MSTWWNTRWVSLWSFQSLGNQGLSSFCNKKFPPFYWTIFRLDEMFIGINVILSLSQGFQLKPFQNVNKLTRFPYVSSGIFVASEWQDASNNPMKLCEILNPNNKFKRLIMIVCMGAKKLSEKSFALVLAMRNIRHIVTCFSDPMHGSTIKTTLGLEIWRPDAILVNLTILTPLSIPWCVDEDCLVYWGYPWTNSLIHFLPQNVNNQTHTHVHSLKQNTTMPAQFYINDTFSMCDSKLIMCMSRSICLVSNMLMKASICATIISFEHICYNFIKSMLQDLCN